MHVLSKKTRIMLIGCSTRFFATLGLFFLGLLSQISLINPALPSHDTRISAESGNFLSPPPTYPNTIQPKQSNHDRRTPDSILLESRNKCNIIFPTNTPQTIPTYYPHYPFRLGPRIGKMTGTMGPKLGKHLFKTLLLGPVYLESYKLLNNRPQMRRQLKWINF